MHFGSFVLLLVLASALCVLINCQEDEDVDRRDVHRIILKPEKSKKHRKRTKAPRTTRAPKPYRPTQHLTSFDNAYEPIAHASSTRYQKRPRPQYPNHHDEYHDLVNPRPPQIEDAAPYSYPEEENRYHETAASNHENYLPVLQNSGGKLNAYGETQAGVFVDWNPIPSTQLTHDDYHPPATSAATAAHDKRRKTARRTTARPSAVIFMTSTTYAPPPTTSTPLTYHEHFAGPVAQALVMKPRPQSQQVKVKTQLHQQHHYVNYNHNNKSHIRYEVSESARGKGVAALPPPPPPAHKYTNAPTHVTPVVESSFGHPVFQTIRHNQDAKSSISNVDNSYEVFERTKDYNKQIKQTSFKGTQAPPPIYSQFQPFLPTVSTYSMLVKSTKPPPVATQLDFGKKQPPTKPLSQLQPILPTAAFGKLYLGVH